MYHRVASPGACIIATGCVNERPVNTWDTPILIGAGGGGGDGGGGVAGSLLEELPQAAAAAVNAMTMMFRVKRDNAMSCLQCCQAKIKDIRDLNVCHGVSKQRRYSRSDSMLHLALPTIAFEFSYFVKHNVQPGARIRMLLPRR